MHSIWQVNKLNRLLHPPQKCEPLPLLENSTKPKQSYRSAYLIQVERGRVFQPPLEPFAVGWTTIQGILSRSRRKGHILKIPGIHSVYKTRSSEVIFGMSQGIAHSHFGTAETYDSNEVAVNQPALVQVIDCAFKLR